MENFNIYDIIIVGAGHAGCESANAVTKMGFKTLLLTLNFESIGFLPCNPSIGGPAKSHLVFEIDALGGLMGKIADKSVIQKKILNKKKGPAVQSLRFQVDKLKYSNELFLYLNKIKNLDIFQGEATEIIIEKKNKKVKGIKLNTGIVFYGKKIIISTGTYLCSEIIIGEYKKKSGPNELNSSNFLSESLNKLGFETRKFKTGTSPRIDKRTINYKNLIEEKGEKKNYKFSFFNEIKHKKQSFISCYSTYTTKITKKIIKKNLKKSPLFSGTITGIGPRYCPSIEDKIVRFSEKEKHHLFIEPESKNHNEMYLQGFSTSMPAQIQQNLVNSIIGLEKAKIMKLGYAIEYDVINSQELFLSLESRKYPGLFFAGQINGTSGYEEAASQGIIAGINAGLSLKNKKPFILKRSESYIGVLIDDLITKGTNEPYRMFTSRAEYRLLLRQGNSDERLLKKAYNIGMIDKKKYKFFNKKQKNIKIAIEELKKNIICYKDKKTINLLKRKKTSLLNKNIKAIELLKRPEIAYKDILKLIESTLKLSLKEKEEISLRVKYEGYIKKQIEQIKNFNKKEKKLIPINIIDFKEIKGLRNEAIEKLNKIKPISIGHASRIPGVSPADIQILLIFLEYNRRK